MPLLTELSQYLQSWFYKYFVPNGTTALTAALAGSRLSKVS